MIFLDFLKVKKIMKICSKKHQIAPVKNFFRGSMPPNPPSKATRRKPPPPQKKIVGSPWQILHTPMNYC